MDSCSPEEHRLGKVSSESPFLSLCLYLNDILFNAFQFLFFPLSNFKKANFFQDSPSNKLLYAKEIPDYKKKVAR